MMIPKTRLRLPSGKYSSLGRNFQAPAEATQGQPHHDGAGDARLRTT